MARGRGVDSFLLLPQPSHFRICQHNNSIQSYDSNPKSVVQPHHLNMSHFREFPDQRIWSTTLEGRYGRQCDRTISDSSLFSRPISNPLELFVGNLSYFCTEEDLYELFNQFVNVTSVRVMRADDKKRSLMFGFVTVSVLQEVDMMANLLNGHLFMGRQLRYAYNIHIVLDKFSFLYSFNRVEAAANATHKSPSPFRPFPPTLTIPSRLWKIHVAISSTFTVSLMISLY